MKVWVEKDEVVSGKRRRRRSKMADTASDIHEGCSSPEPIGELHFPKGSGGKKLLPQTHPTVET